MTESIEKYQKLCAVMYQFAGNHRASREMLDVLSKAAAGEPFTVDVAALLPVTNGCED